MTKKQITLYVWKNKMQTVKAVQGEVDSRFLEITLKDDFGGVDLSNKSVQIYARKPDGNIIYNNVEIIDKTKGIVSIGLTSEMSAVSGILQDCEIRVLDLDTGNTLKFNGLNIVISKGMPDSEIESTSEFTALQEAISRYDELNKTIEEHLYSSSNPHEVTAEQVGAPTLNPDGKLSGDYLSESSITTKKLASSAVTSDKLSDGSVITDKISNAAITSNKLSNGSITTEKIASGASIDKWKGVIRYNKVSELGLDIDTCTIDDIVNAMPNNSYLEAEKSGNTVSNAFPETYGILMVHKLTAWKVSLKFSTDTTNSGTGNRVRVWEGIWRERVTPAFSGWKKVYTSNELISLSDIDTGAIQDNLFVAENCTDGGYYNYSTLEWVSASGVSETEFMPCNEGEHFTFYTGQSNALFHIVFKNSSGEIFTGIRCNSNANKIINFTMPYGATSFACAFNTSYKSEIQIGHSSILNNTLSEYVKGINNDFFKGKKMNCLGDSITYGSTPSSGSQMSNPYPAVLKELLGLDTVRNYGISGSSLAVGGDNPMVTRYTSMDNDADIVCVFGGTNDWGKTDTSKQRELGTIDSTDNTTVYGALNEMCSGLISKYPKATIFLITPLHRTNETTPNTHSYILEDVVMAIKEVGSKFGIPVLDLFSSGNFYPTNSTQNTNCSSDGLHPNQWFHENVLARKIARFIKSII